jgi:hypothetical protein
VSIERVKPGPEWTEPPSKDAKPLTRADIERMCAKLRGNGLPPDAVVITPENVHEFYDEADE